MWKLTDLAEAQLEKLSADGITPTAQEILDIQCLSLEAEGKVLDEITLAQGRPYRIGGIILYPLTIAASYWYTAFCNYTDNEVMTVYGLAYAMTYGHDAAKLTVAGAEAVTAVKHFAQNLTCTFSELVRAMATYNDDRPYVQLDKSDGDTDPRNSLGRLSSMATSLFGGDPAVWEYQCSISYVSQMIDTYTRVILLKGNNDSKGIDGLRKLAKYVADLREKHHGKL